MSTSQKPLRSESGFESPGFKVDTYGNVNITGAFKLDGSPIFDSSGALSSAIIYSNLVQVGTLSSLNVSGAITAPSGTITSFGATTLTTSTLTTSGTLTINPYALAISPATIGSLNNVNIGNITPSVGKFTTLTITSTPTLSTDATTKQYVDSKAIALSIALGS